LREYRQKNSERDPPMPFGLWPGALWAVGGPVRKRRRGKTTHREDGITQNWSKAEEGKGRNAKGVRAAEGGGRGGGSTGRGEEGGGWVR